MNTVAAAYLGILIGFVTIGLLAFWQVPILYMSLFLLFGQLVMRRNERFH